MRIILVGLLGLIAVVLLATSGRRPSNDERETERPHANDATRAGALLGSPSPSAVGVVAATQDIGPVARVPWHVRVRVIDSGTGAPIPGAVVSLYWSAQVPYRFHFVAKGTVDHAGIADVDLTAWRRESLAMLSYRSLHAWAAAPGYVGTDNDEPPRVWSLTDDIDSGWVVDDVYLDPLARGERTGRVVWTDGTPVLGAWVGWRVAPDDDDVGSHTDIHGSFVLPVCEHATELRVVREDAREALRIPVAKVPPGPLVLTLRRVEETSGRVMYADGTAVRDFELTLGHQNFDIHYYVRMPRLLEVRARTNAAGRFWAHLPIGYEPWGTGSMPFAQSPFYAVSPGLPPESTPAVDTGRGLQITVRAHRLRVRLRDKHNAPLPGYLVHLFVEGGEEATAFADGEGEVSAFVAPGSTVRLCACSCREGVDDTEVKLTVPCVGNESVHRMRVR